MKLLITILSLCLSFTAISGEKDLILQLKSISTKSKTDFFNKLKRKGIANKRAIIEDLNIYMIKVDSKTNSKALLKSLRTVRSIKHVQFDHPVTMRSTKPNDPLYDKLWSLKPLSSEGDIDAHLAWDISKGGNNKKGEEVVVAVVDRGVDQNHSDLQGNLWKNKAEIPGNGVDDDGNGYIDDVNGWNAYDRNGNLPTFLIDHGTHVAGIIGAKGNNGTGITGVNWNTKIMAVAGSSGMTSVVLEAYGYVLKQKKLWISSGGKKGANVVVTNSSFGVDKADCTSPDFSLWNEVYNEMGKVGILSAAATINMGVDVDEEGDVPTTCKSDYLVTVTNTTNKNKIYYSAGFGADSIDLGAPGTDIYSTIPGNGYDTKTGTSMATPHVAGAIALMHSAASTKFLELYKNDPAKGAKVLKNILLDNTDDVSDLKGVTVTGGKLNLHKAVADISNY
jgi:subtilisin family serine protease